MLTFKNIWGLYIICTTFQVIKIGVNGDNSVEYRGTSSSFGITGIAASIENVGYISKHNSDFIIYILMYCISLNLQSWQVLSGNDRSNSIYFLTE